RPIAPWSRAWASALANWPPFTNPALKARWSARPTRTANRSRKRSRSATRAAAPASWIARTTETLDRRDGGRFHPPMTDVRSPDPRLQVDALLREARRARERSDAAA